MKFRTFDGAPALIYRRNPPSEEPLSYLQGILKTIILNRVEGNGSSSIGSSSKWMLCYYLSTFIFSILGMSIKVSEKYLFSKLMLKIHDLRNS